MTIVSAVLVALVGLLHVYFLYLEMFAWQKPTGLRVFRNTPQKAADSAVLAANQGLYNGFLAAGLFWALVQPNPLFAFQLTIFFLGCVIVAAAYGGWSVSRRIFFVQGGPAILALIVALIFANPYLIAPVTTG